eukprot:CAMPEP_0170182944 /NCGR_PEP_ID=MMETSP0040_2-20121228/29195_1 /TAXON_ID=641309 /ORGANISM="Lotharella oceanica, Strain CCMP622" /LENGTH=239 /DNA_ID=CAMNT_0010428527 /DNA_START=119 /DNA_END=838 /DNA_ORIENTATION=-
MCSMARAAGERVFGTAKDKHNCNYWGEWIDGWARRGEDRSRITCENRLRVMKEHNKTWSQIETQIGPGDVCPGDFINIIVLREPISRLLSFMNYKFDGPLPSASPESINACLSQGIHCIGNNGVFNAQQLDNFITRTLAGGSAWEVDYGGLNSTHFEAAKARLSMYDIVLTLESLNDARANKMLDAALGWHVVMKPCNTGTGLYEFSAKSREALAGINHYDLELYQHALEKLNIGATKL